MKHVLILSLFILSFSSYAANPQIRVCNSTASQFWVVDAASGWFSSVGFCKFDNSAMIGSISMMKYLFHNELTDAAKAYISTKQGLVSSCYDAGATKLITVDSNHTKRDVCFFQDDHSFIEKETLLNGWNSVSNRNLSNIIK